jgi:arsenate reductase (glutaredoxin)
VRGPVPPLSYDVPRPTFYWKPSCTTCRNARKFLANAGVDVVEVDINREPPSRAFLEQHIEEGRFFDYISRHSPVFKQRPLPQSKKEAIDLMMENANLIKRPVLVKGTRAIFGFDRKKYQDI